MASSVERRAYRRPHAQAATLPHPSLQAGTAAVLRLRCTGLPLLTPPPLKITAVLVLLLLSPFAVNCCLLLELPVLLLTLLLVLFMLLLFLSSHHDFDYSNCNACALIELLLRITGLSQPVPHDNVLYAWASPLAHLCGPVRIISPLRCCNHLERC
ncbi:hypothetical protein JKP88DRAFT_249256 [Tribonema minus]|uniref:Uncharacterized protein n=1 Tax=Tribonema minus TaxID=303371 RepID=A0A835YN77_9STRA|nr:hypothetical protein JKP88DRAFT_249256 [Tribonema minus]